MTEKQRRRLLSFVIVLCICGIGGGCDYAPPLDDSQGGVQSKASALNASTEGSDTASPSGGGDGEGPIGPVTLKWMDITMPETEGVEELNLNVTNNLDIEIEIKADIHCDAFANKSASRPFVPHTLKLAPHEETVLNFKTKHLPIQNIVGASTFQAVVRVTNSISDQEIAVPTMKMLYRFDSSYKSIAIFDQAMLIQKYGGMFFDASDTKKDEASVGRMLDASDNPVVLKQKDIVGHIKPEEGGEGEFLLMGSGTGISKEDEIARFGGAQ
jgi:hypothetical protein